MFVYVVFKKRWRAVDPCVEKPEDWHHYNKKGERITDLHNEEWAFNAPVVYDWEFESVHARRPVINETTHKIECVHVLDGLERQS